MKINIKNNFPLFLLGLFCGSVFTLLLNFYYHQSTYKDDKEIQRLNFGVEEDLYRSDIKSLSLLDNTDSLGTIDESKFCWDTIKLINGEILTGAFANGFDDGEYFLRKDDRLFIPMQNVLYYK